MLLLDRPIASFEIVENLIDIFALIAPRLWPPFLGRAVFRYSGPSRMGPPRNAVGKFHNVHDSTARPCWNRYSAILTAIHPWLWRTSSTRSVFDGASQHVKK